MFTGVTMTSKLGAESSIIDLPYPVSYIVVVGASLLVCLIVTMLTPPVNREHLALFYAKVLPVGAWKPFGTNPSGQVAAILAGWGGGIALIYGLLFGIGGLLLGDSFVLPFCCALLGAVVLRWSWPHTAV